MHNSTVVVRATTHDACPLKQGCARGRRVVKAFTTAIAEFSIATANESHTRLRIRRIFLNYNACGSRRGGLRMLARPCLHACAAMDAVGAQTMERHLKHTGPNVARRNSL
jgi:hypothetical protein